MNKKTIQKVLLACAGFLIFIAFMSYVLRQQNTQSKPMIAESKEKVIYLTFDDGPSQNTKEILDILDTYEVKATFFVTGISTDHADMIKEEARRGHTIGIHTFSHDYQEIYSSEEAYFKDIAKANDLIKKQTGTQTTLLRFPGGTSNTVSRKYCSGIMSQLAKDVVERGYQYYDWNAENGDGNSDLDADTLLNKALKDIKHKDEVMMLMHDGGGNGATVTALPAFLKAAKEQGFVFKTIDATTPIFHHHIAN